MNLEELLASDGSAGAPLAELEGGPCRFTWATGYENETESCGDPSVAVDLETREPRCLRDTADEIPRQCYGWVPYLPIERRLADGARTLNRAPGELVEEYGR